MSFKKLKMVILGLNFDWIVYIAGCWYCWRALRGKWICWSGCY